MIIVHKVFSLLVYASFWILARLTLEKGFSSSPPVLRPHRSIQTWVGWLAHLTTPTNRFDSISTSNSSPRGVYMRSEDINHKIKGLKYASDSAIPVVTAKRFNRMFPLVQRVINRMCGVCSSETCLSSRTGPSRTSKRQNDILGFMDSLDQTCTT